MSWNKYKTISLILSLFISLPIWFYLMYTVISYANPDRFVWFLFWIYLPISILGTIIAKVAEGD